MWWPSGEGVRHGGGLLAASSVMSAIERAAEPCVAAPVLLTVREAMAVLRVGRTTLYEQANLFLATDGVEGVPVVRIGKQLRFPRAALEELIGGPIGWPTTEPADPAAVASPARLERQERSSDSPRLFSV